MDINHSQKRVQFNFIFKIEKNDNFAYCGTSTGDVMKVRLSFSDDLTDIDPKTPPTLIGCYARIPRKRQKTKHLQPELYSQGNPNGYTN